MDRRGLVCAVAALACMLVVVPGRGADDPVASDALVTSLEELGLTQAQAEKGLGALLALAQERLIPEDFDTVARAIPNAREYVRLAKMQGVVWEPVNDAGDLGPIFRNLGFSREAAAGFAPAVLDYLGRQPEHEEARDLLSQVLE